MNSLVSVLMPMKNAEEYVGESIISILEQTHSNLELIIVNDCSDDNSEGIVNKIHDSRIKIIQGSGHGISQALNLAVANASGEYLCRCDADDTYPKGRVETQSTWLDNHDEYVAISGGFSCVDSIGSFVSTFNTGNVECDITKELLMGITRTHLGTFMIKKTAMDTVGGFRDYFVTAEDIDMQLRLAECGPTWYTPNNMYFYRLHEGSITHTQSTVKRVYYESFARECLNQRIISGLDQLQKGVQPEPPASADQPRETEEQILNYMLAESWQMYFKNKKKLAVIVAFKMCRRQPMRLSTWRNLFVVIIKSSWKLFRGKA